MTDIAPSIKWTVRDGLGLMTVYQVYPGIQLIYNDFEATSCYWDGTIDKECAGDQSLPEGREGERIAKRFLPVPRRRGSFHSYNG